MSSSNSTNSRDTILDAAAAILTKHGVSNVSIQATATAAGITKAGLIYHFKTRDELLSALLERMVTELDTQIGLPVSDQPQIVSPQAKIAELVDFTFDMPASQKQLLANMLVAATAHPHLLPQVQALFSRGYDALGRSPNPALFQLLSLAMDGLLLLELLQLHKFTPDQRAAMRETLLELARELP